MSSIEDKEHQEEEEADQYDIDALSVKVFDQLKPTTTPKLPTITSTGPKFEKNKQDKMVVTSQKVERLTVV